MCAASAKRPLRAPPLPIPAIVGAQGFPPLPGYDRQDSSERVIIAHRRPGMADSEIIFAVAESPEGGYEARALGYSIYTEADTLTQLKTMIRDAVRCHFESENKPR